MNIKIVNKSSFPLPKYESALASGLDLRLYMPADALKMIAQDDMVFKNGDALVIKPFGRVLLPTGIYVAIPEGYEGQVRPRSGNALKKGIGILNSPGTIDADYRGEIGIILYNSTNNPLDVKHGDKLAQLVICPVEQSGLIEVNELPSTVRGDGGFGSTEKV